jgi:hypothetical protein
MRATMRRMAEDALLTHHELLQQRVTAWREAWAKRGEAPTAAVTQLLGEPYLGATVAQHIETRLLETRRDIDNAIARYAGLVAAAVVLLCKAGTTDGIERKTQEAFLKIGRQEDGFETKMVELGPLVELYRRLSTAMDHPRRTPQ